MKEEMSIQEWADRVDSWLKYLRARVEDLETAVGDLQGTREITDVPLTDELIKNELEYVAADEDEELKMELASWERFNTRFENLPEQGGPYYEER